MKNLFLLLMLACCACAQTVANVGVTDQGPTSVRIAGTNSVDGWLQVNYGVASGGPYPYSSGTYCTNSPQIVFSGGSPNSQAVAYINTISGTGVPTSPVILYKGDYAGTPTAVLNDTCIPSYVVTAATWSGGIATLALSGDGAGSFYVGQTISVTGTTPSGWIASNVAVTAVIANAAPVPSYVSYALASNPGSFTPASTALLTSAAGSGATIGVTMGPSSNSIMALTWSSGGGGTATATVPAGTYTPGQTISVVNTNPAGWEVTNVTVSAVSGHLVSYPLASNPGSYTQQICSVGGGCSSQMTSSATKAVVGLTITGGTTYHGQDYNLALAQPLSGQTGTAQWFLALGGLTPGTTYYAVPTWRPHMNDSSGLVTGSPFTFSTTAACVGPCVPAAPTSTYQPYTPANHPTFPTTGCTDYPYSGTPCYHVIPIAFNSGLGECAATAKVGPFAYSSTMSWQANVNDTVQVILNEIRYGAILEFAQGSQCPIPQSFNVCPSSSVTYAGIYHWCALPPDPAATGINDPAHRFIVIRTHQNAATDFPPWGFLIDTSWESKLANVYSAVNKGINTGYSGSEGFAVDSDSTYAGPVHHYWLTDFAWDSPNIGSHGNGLNLGVGNGQAPQLYPPQYIVVDQFLIHNVRNANTTMMAAGISGIPGPFTSISNSTIDTPDNNQQLALGIYFTDCGGPGPLNLDNVRVSAVGQGIYIESTGIPSCDLVPPVSQATQANTPAYTDITILKPHLYLSLCTLSTSGCWDMFSRPPVRNQFEEKIGVRGIISGATCNGQWNQDTLGECFAFTPTLQPSIGVTGSHDWLLENSIITNAAIIATMSGSRTLGNGGPPDPAITSNITLFNNLAFTIGKNIFGAGPGAYPGYFSSNFCGQNITFKNNTWPFVNGNVPGGGGIYEQPVWFATGSGGALCGGWTNINNFMSLDGGGVSLSGVAASYDLGCCVNFPAAPNITPTNPTTAQSWAQAFIAIAASVTPNAIVESGNIITPGLYGTGATNWTPMTDAEVATLAALNPTGSPIPDKYICSDPGYPSTCAGTPASLAAGLAAAGIPGRDAGDPTCSATLQNPCAGGVNLRALEAAQGIVSQISVSCGPTACAVTYLPPDARGCSVDMNATRTTDTGGAGMRTIMVTGLAAATSYPYKLMCYYSQTAANSPWFTAPWNTTNLITDGVSAVTAAAGTRTVSVSGVMPAGAVTASYTITPVNGSPVSLTCSSFPCSIPGIANGGFLTSVAYKNSGGVTIATANY